MSSKGQLASILILLSLSTVFSFTIKSSHAGGIAIYWGQNDGDGTLTSTCDTGNFDIVLLAFLNDYGCGTTPSWNFDGHCGSRDDPCTKLQPEIQYCQQKGIKVFLSLGGASGNYSLCSPEDAKWVANYLYTNFLSGQFGPLGSVTLDGIDFATVKLRSNYYLDDLVRELDALRKQNRYFYLSAAPQCLMLDSELERAIKTGLFDNVLVQFYNNPPCQYNSSSGDASWLLQSWDAWTSSLVMPNNTVFMGLPASPHAAPSGGYIPPNDLITKVLPYIKRPPNYGGIMLWDRFHDVENKTHPYSDQIKGYVSNYIWEWWPVTGISNTISECVSAALHRILPKQYY